MDPVLGSFSGPHFSNPFSALEWPFGAPFGVHFGTFFGYLFWVQFWTPKNTPKKTCLGKGTGSAFQLMFSWVALHRHVQMKVIQELHIAATQIWHSSPLSTTFFSSAPLPAALLSTLSWFFRSSAFTFYILFYSSLLYSETHIALNSRPFLDIFLGHFGNTEGTKWGLKCSK